MKINFIEKSNLARNGYTNLCPFEGNEQLNVKRHEITHLNRVVDNGEASEIIIHNLLDYMPYNAIEEFLSVCAKKLAINGIIKILGIECLELFRNILQANISFEKLNSVLYRHASQKSASSSIDIRKFLENNSILINGVTIDVYNYYIEGIKI